MRNVGILRSRCCFYPFLDFWANDSHAPVRIEHDTVDECPRAQRPDARSAAAAGPFSKGVICALQWPPGKDLIMPHRLAGCEGRGRGEGGVGRGSLWAATWTRRTSSSTCRASCPSPEPARPRVRIAAATPASRGPRRAAASLRYGAEANRVRCAGGSGGPRPVARRGRRGRRGRRRRRLRPRRGPVSAPTAALPHSSPIVHTSSPC